MKRTTREKLRSLKCYVGDRLREASTWRGFTLIAAALGASVSPDKAEAIVILGLFISGAVGAMFPDRRTDKSEGGASQ
jgi:hypothetical protein